MRSEPPVASANTVPTSGTPATRIEEAGGRAVVVTRTVRDLATGTDLSFEPLGAVGMRGIPGNWELFEASIR